MGAFAALLRSGGCAPPCCAGEEAEARGGEGTGRRPGGEWGLDSNPALVSLLFCCRRGGALARGPPREEIRLECVESRSPVMERTRGRPLSMTLINSHGGPGFCEHLPPGSYRQVRRSRALAVILTGGLGGAVPGKRGQVASAGWSCWGVRWSTSLDVHDLAPCSRGPGPLCPRAPSGQQGAGCRALALLFRT